MKTIKYMYIALFCMLLTGCMNDDWKEPNGTQSIGNPALAESNVITIATLKTQYASFIYTPANTYTQITDDVQIKGRVVGNDIGGNVYSEVAIDDGTGAILICISQNGLFAELPVGQEILVSLKGLYIGGYGLQAEIGTPFTNARNVTYVSRMSRTLWQEHFKLLGMPDALQVQAEVFDISKIADEDYLKSHSGKLMTIKGVTFAKGDGKTAFAPSEEKDKTNNVSRALKGYDNRTIVVRTSTYADFAATTLPTGSVDITGIFTRYRDTWQILMRTEKDIH